MLMNETLTLILIISILVVTIVVNLPTMKLFNNANAHFFGLPFLQNKTVGEYKVVFQPFPTVPIPGSNSTMINLSILDKDGQNIVGVFTSLNIKEKDTGEILKNFPYKFHEFSDMTYPFTFPKDGTYVVSLQSKINGDPVYSEKPLIVDFDLPVKSNFSSTTFTEILTYYLTPALAVLAGIAVYLRMKNKI